MGALGWSWTLEVVLVVVGGSESLGAVGVAGESVIDVVVAPRMGESSMMVVESGTVSETQLALLPIYPQRLRLRMAL